MERCLVLLSLMVVLSACLPAPMPVSTPTITDMAIPEYNEPFLGAELLSSLNISMSIPISPFDTLTINLPAPSSDPSIVIPQASEQPSSLCPTPDDAVISLQGIGTQPWIQTYLNHGGPVSNLEKLLNMELCRQGCYAKETMATRIYHVDVTGDAMPEVLIVSKSGFRYYVPHVSLSLYYCHNGQYAGGQVLHAEGYPFGEPDLGILSIQDANNNGIPEIVFAYKAISGAETRRCVQTLEWNGNEMVILDMPQ